MSKNECKSIPSITDCITLESVAFLLVGNAELHARVALECNCLLIYRHILTCHPHQPHLFIQMMQHEAYLPQGILGSCIFCILTEIIQTEETPKMSPSANFWDVTSPWKLLVHKWCNEIATQQLISGGALKPLGNIRLWCKSVCK